MRSIFAALALRERRSFFQAIRPFKQAQRLAASRAPLQVERSSLKISVRPLCSLCLCGEWLPTKFHHGDTEHRGGTEESRA